jgi:hypothetical protein
VRAADGAALSVLVWAVAYGSANAEDALRDARDRKLFRLELANDEFLDSDDAFTAGWSVQVHSPLLDEWPTGLDGWVGRVPGLGDDGTGARVVRRAWGITQMTITPADIAIASPQLEDLPWAGILGNYVSWSSYDNERLSALQIYFGCMGSCSHAEEVQKLMHNSLGRGKAPEGWPNQLADQPLLNVNYESRRKLWASKRNDDPGRWSHDLSVGAQAGLGNFATYGQAWLEYRFGWGVPEGFTNFGDPPGLGIALDPTYVDPLDALPQRTWRPHFSVAARLRSIRRFAPFEGGATDNGGFHPRLESVPGDRQLLFGIHVDKVPLAFHLNYYFFLDGEHFLAATGGELDWVNFSFERRF